MFTSEYHETITVIFKYNERATYKVASIKTHNNIYEIIHYTKSVVAPNNKLTELIPCDSVEKITLHGYGHTLSHYK